LSIDAENLLSEFAIVHVAPSGSTRMAPRVEEQVNSNPAPADAGMMLNKTMNLNEELAERDNSHPI
jgi:hypothetical protein